MILVTGANGHLGRAIVEHLSRRAAPARIIAASREPDTLSPPDGVAVRRADFADQASLPGAFAGIERIEIVSVDKLGEEARRLHRNAIAAARDAGSSAYSTPHMPARARDRPFRPPTSTPRVKRTWRQAARRSRRCGTASTPRAACR